jgi:glycosyltransferase involved in cell wall biosynthesis
MASKKIQIVGPYFTNYSLARVNRGLAIALKDLHSNYDVNLYCDPAKIDYYPAPEELQKNRQLADIVIDQQTETEVAIYNNYPRSISDSLDLQNLPGKIKLMYLAWEESKYVKHWVDEINANLHGVMVPSSFVKSILRSSGVKLPIRVVPNAINTDQLKSVKENYEVPTTKKIRFLHVSSGLKRKGVDVLIKSYLKEFKSTDDVTLIIKSFPGPTNIVEEYIEKYKTEDSAEIIHISSSDMTDTELLQLTKSVDCCVYPSRSEGFGLPVLEAMNAEVPVIATNYSGYLDFCDHESAYMIDYKLVYTKGSDLVNPGAKWAEPDVSQLQNLMRKVYETQQKIKTAMLQNSKNDPDIIALQTRVIIAKQRANRFSWENSAKEVLNFIQEVEQVSIMKDKNVAVLSFINDETGIADYTHDLFTPFSSSFKNLYIISNSDVADKKRKDEKNILRLWESGEERFEKLLLWVAENEVDIFHIQYHSGVMFSIEALDYLIKKLHTLKIKTFLTLHAVRGDSFDYIKESKSLKLVDRILIHNPQDFKYARTSLKNVELFTLPTIEYSKRDKLTLKQGLGFSGRYPIIATHGLLNSNKGVENIMDAIIILKRDYPNCLLLCLNAVSANNIYSQGILEKLQKKIEENDLGENVILVTEFLDQHIIEILLQSVDLTVFAYTDAGESASGAVRRALATFSPIIVTDINTFQELDKEVLKIKDNGVISILEGIGTVLDNPDLSKRLSVAAKKFVTENSHDKKIFQTMRSYASLV